VPLGAEGKRRRGKKIRLKTIRPSRRGKKGKKTAASKKIRKTPKSTRDMISQKRISGVNAWGVHQGDRPKDAIKDFKIFEVGSQRTRSFGWNRKMC